MIFTDDFDCVFVAGLAKFELIKFHLFLKTSKVSKDSMFCSIQGFAKVAAVLLL